MAWDLVGHGWAVALLEGQRLSRRVRHAYLFTGAAGIGKRTLAKRFAMALNCLGPEANAPCGE